MSYACSSSLVSSCFEVIVSQLFLATSTSDMTRFCLILFLKSYVISTNLKEVINVVWHSLLAGYKDRSKLCYPCHLITDDFLKHLKT